MERGASTLAQGLVVTWLLVAVALCALAMLLYIAIRNRARRVTLEEAVEAVRSLDLDAFRNLVDPDEEAFLRDSLPPKEFRKIKRQRVWAAIIYVREVGRAAAALAAVGQAAQRSSDAAMATSGLQVAENAFRLRLQAARVSFHLLTEIILPDLQSRSFPTLLDQYHRSAETLFQLGRLPSEVRELTHYKS